MLALGGVSMSIKPARPLALLLAALMLFAQPAAASALEGGAAAAVNEYTEGSYPDVSQSVYACNAAGLVMGVPGGAFRPFNSTVRRDAAIVFARYARRIGAVPSGGQ